MSKDDIVIVDAAEFHHYQVSFTFSDMPSKCLLSNKARMVRTLVIVDAIFHDSDYQ